MMSRVKERVEGAWQRRPPALRPQRRATPSATPQAPVDRSAELRDLRVQRDRLVEKFTIMENDLGGAFYEMAIRDHVRLDVLTRKAAELQRVDHELAAIETTLQIERSDAAGICHSCGAPYSTGTRFCGQCGTSLTSAAGLA
jgi:hypothetical protein